MARNMKPEYINKLRRTEAPDGYKFDIANYIYNPSFDNDYPAFVKVIAEDENTKNLGGYDYDYHQQERPRSCTHNKGKHGGID